MSTDLGKAFEQRFLKDWKKCFPNSFIYRLHDQVTGYKITSRNPADYIGFVDRTLFLLELKSHDGASIDFSAIPQYSRLLEFKDIPYVKPGILIWFKQKDKIIWVPIQIAEKIYMSGEKSIGLRHLEKFSDIIVIPGIKKRVFIESDYSVLLGSKDGE